MYISGPAFITLFVKVHAMLDLASIQQFLAALRVIRPGLMRSGLYSGGAAAPGLWKLGN